VPGREIRAAPRRGEGAGLRVLASGRRRAGARHAGAGPLKLDGDRRQYPAGTLDGFDDEPGVARQPACRRSWRARSATDHAGLTPRGAGRPPSARHRASSATPSPAMFEIGMSEYDAELRVHAAQRGAGLFQPRGDVTVIEVLLDDPDRVGERARRSSPARRPIFMSPTGASATRPSSPRCRSSAT
jgi:hypothetical protein